MEKIRKIKPPRMAAASKALNISFTVEDVMKQGRWSSREVFEKFYNRSKAKNFGSILLEERWSTKIATYFGVILNVVEIQSEDIQDAIKVYLRLYDMKWSMIPKVPPNPPQKIKKKPQKTIDSPDRFGNRYLLIYTSTKKHWIEDNKDRAAYFGVILHFISYNLGNNPIASQISSEFKYVDKFEFESFKFLKK
jgi:hypothetical protein